jgi:hypothetical protein
MTITPCTPVKAGVYMIGGRPPLQNSSDSLKPEWVVESGNIQILIASSSADTDVKLKKTIAFVR